MGMEGGRGPLFCCKERGWGQEGHGGGERVLRGADPPCAAPLCSALPRIKLVRQRCGLIWGGAGTSHSTRGHNRRDGAGGSGVCWSAARGKLYRAGNCPAEPEPLGKRRERPCGGGAGPWGRSRVGSHGRATHVEAACGPAPARPGPASSGIPRVALPPARAVSGMRGWNPRDRDRRVGTPCCAPRPGVGAALRDRGHPRAARVPELRCPVPPVSPSGALAWLLSPTLPCSACARTASLAAALSWGLSAGMERPGVAQPPPCPPL